MDDFEDSPQAEIEHFGGGMETSPPMTMQERRNLVGRQYVPSLLRGAPPQLKGDRFLQQEFCAVLAATGVVARALEATGVNRTSVWNLRKSDKEFADMYDAAMAAFVDGLESEAIRRGAEGVEVPIVSQGRVIATKKEHDTPLLLALLKRHSAEWRAALAGGSGTTVNVTASAHAGAQALASGTPESLPDRIRALPAAQRDALRAALQALAPSSAAQLTGPPEPRQGLQEGQEQGEAPLDVEPGAETKLDTP